MRLTALNKAVSSGVALPPQPFYVSSSLFEKARNGSNLFPSQVMIWNGVILRVCDRLQAHDANVYYFDRETNQLVPVQEVQQNTMAVGQTAFSQLSTIKS
jgi:hypothetical protein